VIDHFGRQSQPQPFQRTTYTPVAQGIASTGQLCEEIR
jgi:hypothetical protein